MASLGYGYLRLETCPHIGSAFGGVTFALSGATLQVAGVFRAVVSDTINTITWRVTAGGGASQVYRFGIQTLDASGNPSGTYINSGNAFGDVTITGTGEWTATITASSITAGTDYAVVVSVVSGTPSATFGYGFNNVNSRSPYGLTYNGTAWTKTANRPNFLLTGSLMNHGEFYSLGSTTTVTNGNEIAQLIQFPSGMASSITAYGMEIPISIMTAAASIDALLYTGNGSGDTTSTTLISGSSAVNQGGTGNASLQIIFTTPAVFTPGLWYRIGYRNNTGSTITQNLVSYGSTASMSQLPLGAAGLSTRSGGSWTDTATSRLPIALLINDITGGGGGVPRIAGPRF